MKPVPSRHDQPSREHPDRSTAWASLLFGLILVSTSVAGCSPRSVEDVPVSERATVPDEIATPLVLDDVAPPVGYPLAEDLDVWDAVYAMGRKVGRQHVRVRRMSDGDEVRIESTSRMTFLRSGQPVEVNTTVTSRETSDGRLIDFEALEGLGSSPMRTRGRVEDDRLHLEITVRGQKRSVELPWSASDGGFQAVEFSLLAQPMRPGETRSLRALLPVLNQVATVRLAARDHEEVSLLDGAKRLLRIDARFRLPADARYPDGQTIDACYWIDQRGEVMKTLVDGALRQETFRCDRAEALDSRESDALDIELVSMVALDRPIPRAYATRRVRYRAVLADGDPVAEFASGLSQQVKSLGSHSAELTVVAVRPDEPKTYSADPSDAPTPHDLAANSRIQSDDEQVLAVAKKAVEGKQGDWEKAVALERFVYENMNEEPQGSLQALASAAEVVRTLEGDCTEHAVLLAAMARAEGLPARVAIGLVYVEQAKEPRHAFGYHMWTEIFIGDRWIPMDATLGRGGIGGVHLKLAHASLKDSDAMSPFLPVAKILGQLKLEVLDCE